MFSSERWTLFGSVRGQSITNTLPPYRTQKAKVLSNRHFRRFCFKLFRITFTKLYAVSYFTSSAIRSGETQIFGGIPGFDRVTSLG